MGDIFMRFTKPLFTCLAGAALVGLVGTASLADTTITVSLRDMGSDAMGAMPTNPEMGMAMKNGSDLSKAPTMIDIDKASVPAGKVTFAVTNASQDTVHEMIVSPVADGGALPFVADQNRVDEDGAGHLGEVAELDPGAKGALTLDLKPGTYVLFCNIPGHYQMGMWKTFKVE